MAQVLLPRPEQFHRPFRQLHGHRHDLLDEVHLGAPAEAAAHEGGVQRHPLLVQPAQFRGDIARDGVGLRRCPYFQCIAGVQRGAVHGFHADMGEKRHAVVSRYERVLIQFGEQRIEIALARFVISPHRRPCRGRSPARQYRAGPCIPLPAGWSRPVGRRLRRA